MEETSANFSNGQLLYLLDPGNPPLSECFNVVRMCDKTLFETLPEAQWIQAFEFIAQIIFSAEIDSN